jgi:spore protease
VAEVLAKELTSLFNLPENANALSSAWATGSDTRFPGTKGGGPDHSYAAPVQARPEELKGGMRSVSAFAPGVLGVTGIESAEIIKGVVEKVQPELIIAMTLLPRAASTASAPPSSSPTPA